MSGRLTLTTQASTASIRLGWKSTSAKPAINDDNKTKTTLSDTDWHRVVNGAMFSSKRIPHFGIRLH